MAIQQITTCEILKEIRDSHVEPFLHEEILQFFQDNFDFSIWKWRCYDSEFWTLLNRIYPNHIDYQKSLIYYGSEKEKVELQKALIWIIEVLTDESFDERRIVQALHLSIIVPNFWQFSSESKFQFSEKVQEITVNYIWQKEMEIKFDHNAQRYEKEIITKLLEALVVCDWVIIESFTHQLNSIYNNLIFYSNQKISYLTLIWHYRNESIKLINNETDPVKLLAWISYIPIELNSEFILNINNNLARFLLLIKNKNITIENETLLSNLWSSLDENLLIDWFSIFNKYPVRFPHLQRGIGKFLSTATTAQMKIYIDSLSLEDTHSENVQKCIDMFSESASNQKMNCFLNLAFQKWLNWKPKHSYKVYRSSLDKAIMLYFKDFCDKDSRESFIHSNIEEILKSLSLWFKTRTEFNQYIFEKIAKIQPVCSAIYLLENPNQPFEDCKKQLFTPNYFDTDLRWKSWIKFD